MIYHFKFDETRCALVFLVGQHYLTLNHGNLLPLLLKNQNFFFLHEHIFDSNSCITLFHEMTEYSPVDETTFFIFIIIIFYLRKGPVNCNLFICELLWEKVHNGLSLFEGVIKGDMLWFCVGFHTLVCKVSWFFVYSGGGIVAYAEANQVNSPHITNSSEVESHKKKVVVLGTGWAGTSFLRNLNNPSYEVQVVSPRNYFAFTPLLPSVTCGTVEARSIVEPVRNIVRKVVTNQSNVYQLFRIL